MESNILASFQRPAASDRWFLSQGSEGAISRSKPFKYTYEKEIVMYAYFKRLDYFSTECIYSPNAYRGHARAFLKDLEKVRPTSIIDVIHSGEFSHQDNGVISKVYITTYSSG